MSALCMIPRSLKLQTVYQPGINELTDYQSRNRLFRVAPQFSDSSGPVSGVGQAPGGSVRLSPKPSTPLLVLSDRSPAGKATNALSQPWAGLYLYAYPPIPLLERTLIKIREDQAQEANVITPAEEILVPPSPPDGMRDPTPATMQTGSPVTPTRQGRALPH